MQIYFAALTRDLIPGAEGQLPQADPYPAFALSVCNTRPKSTGQIMLASNEPSDAPKIHFNFLEHDDDLEEMLEGVRILRSLANTPALSKIIEREYNPGPQVETEEQFADDIRARGYSIYHPCGSCRMGPDPQQCVVDSRLRVHGLTGLRLLTPRCFQTSSAVT